MKITEFSLLVMMQKYQLSYHSLMIWQGHVNMKVALEKISKQSCFIVDLRQFLTIASLTLDLTLYLILDYCNSWLLARCCT